MECMPDTGSKSWNIHSGKDFSFYFKSVARGSFVACSLSPHVLRGEGVSRNLIFWGKVFCRGSGGMFLNKIWVLGALRL